MELCAQIRYERHDDNVRTELLLIDELALRGLMRLNQLRFKRFGILPLSLIHHSVEGKLRIQSRFLRILRRGLRRFLRQHKQP